jgi:hypothetical protein
MVNIIIPNFNGADYLGECLDSIREQSFNDIEVVIVDNASSDGSDAMVASKYPEFKLLRQNENLGYAAAVNAGVEACTGEFVIILNSDTRVEPEFVAELHAALVAESQASMAAPKMLFARDPRVINSMGLGYSITGTNHDIGFGVLDGPEFSEKKWIFGPCGGAGMYRRDMLEDVGRFDEEFFMYYEDVDFCFRAQLAGHRCIFVPAARVHHIEGAGSGTLPRPRNYYLARNSLAVIAKNFPASILIRNLHVISWEIIKRTCSPALKGDFSALSGYLSGLIGLAKSLAKRRSIQKLKSTPDADIERILRDNLSVLGEIDLQGRPLPSPSSSDSIGEERKETSS